LPDVLNISSHMSLISLKKENKRKDVESNLQVLKKEKNLISTWTDLIQLNDEEPEKVKSYLLLNSTNTDDFIPYIDLKGRYLD
jgi:adenylate kinase family enzyme